jgi:hypothetical protein
MSLPKIAPIVRWRKSRQQNVHLRERLMQKKCVAFKRSFENARDAYVGSPPRRSASHACRSMESGRKELPALSVEVRFRFPSSLHKKHFALHKSLNCVAANFRQQLLLQQLSLVSRFHWTTSNRVKEGTRMRVQPALKENHLPVSAWCWRRGTKVGRTEGGKNVASR